MMTPGVSVVRIRHHCKSLNITNSCPGRHGCETVTDVY